MPQPAQNSSAGRTPLIPHDRAGGLRRPTARQNDGRRTHVCQGPQRQREIAMANTPNDTTQTRRLGTADHVPGATDVIRTARSQLSQ